MSAASPPIPAPSPPACAPSGTALPLYRLSVAQYHAMIDAGILTENDPVELWKGLLVAKMPKNPPHRVVTRRLRRLLEAVVPAGWDVDAQEPITLPDSEPEPDAVVCREEAGNATDRHPGPADVGLVGEVSDSTLAYDRGAKKALYAGVSIPVYWIVNLVERQVEVYADPSGPGPSPDYASRRDYGVNDDVPVVLDGQEVGRIPVRELLP